MAGVALSDGRREMRHVLWATCFPEVLEDSTMQERSYTCPKCQHKMEPGFIPELAYHGFVFQTHWVRGVPSPASWFQKPWNQLKKLAIRGDYQDFLKVITYRCPDCGYLESYARA
jgi:DNA-directed RNA polymerase subunit RPC12/RpoP